jgi:uncharacterized protein (TIGR03083 family)
LTSFSSTPDQIADIYEASHGRIVELVESSSDDQTATAVPATPGWDVHDVLAHLAAITTDGLAGRITGIPDDEFTAGQIRERKAATVAELIAEWRGNLPSMLDGARAGLVPPNLAVDAITHEQDIRGALGRGRVPDDDAIRFSLGLYAMGCRMRVSGSDVPPLRIQATDSDFELVAGEGEPAASVRASEYDLFRTLSGRRGREAVLALDWDGDPKPYLSCLNVFGAVPDYSVPD